MSYGLKRDFKIQGLILVFLFSSKAAVYLIVRFKPDLHQQDFFDKFSLAVKKGSYDILTSPATDMPVNEREDLSRNF